MTLVNAVVLCRVASRGPSALFQASLQGMGISDSLEEKGVSWSPKAGVSSCL